jgi:uncharacterized protein YecE (DUF72 family)
MDVTIGTAGWSIPRQEAASFPDGGSALQRYARIFRGVEVNSSFYRPHRPATWARWAASVPDGFRFSVKVPKAITHEARLIDADPLIADFASQVELLGSKLAVVLVQLPPSLTFDPAIAEHFFASVAKAIPAAIACEPRHASWFTDEADTLLGHHHVGRVAADPAIAPSAAEPGGWPGLAYWRLHGSPAIYRSPYDAAALAHYAQRIEAIASAPASCWCIFDNTASSAATGNALHLAARLGAAGPGPVSGDR